MYCSTCGDERVFEQPPCSDGHGAECPERACTECGTAVLVGLPPVTAAPVAPVRETAHATVPAPRGAATARAVA
ncbi:hypothetical protein SAMN05443665_103842 [Actinomadura meyerae]|uniref:Uncharacterized protein n=1 Tax=Actinomadura meyerae TaxID=240840 RepID=A0A239NBM7_9ACTN|nr:hypothetical protein [Actinomadura meyerae]SNT51902.1 hypothetical protein SAMN05443665_103842 [Actinomadura meyerae]